MLSRRRTLIREALLFLAAAVVPLIARAQAPDPLPNPERGFPIPGDYVSPANAASAGLALSDRWLGTSPYENPAATLTRGVELSPVYLKVSRQDIASQNRDFTQTFGYFDAAGGALSARLGRFDLTLYGWQPVLRLEEQEYTAGPLAAPGTVHQLDSQREIRSGLALASTFKRLRAGVSGEYVYRTDSYETHERSGNPLAGDSTLDFSGSGIGGSVGLVYEKDPGQVWGYRIGAAAHYTSDLSLSGTAVQNSAGGDTTFDVDVKRGTEWSGGVSGRVMVAPATSILLGVGGRSGQTWDTFGFETQSGYTISGGLDWKDSELPWGARFGVGLESNDGALEQNAGLLSVGFTYVSKGMVLDLGLFHRNLSRDGFPNSADNRLVASVKVDF